MLYFWLRSDDLAEDRTSVDMLSVGPVDVLPDVPVLAAPWAPQALASLRLGVALLVMELPPSRLLSLKTAPSPSLQLSLLPLRLKALQNLTASLIQMRAHTPATMTATSATEDRLILVELDCTGFTVTVNCQ